MGAIHCGHVGSIKGMHLYILYISPSRKVGYSSDNSIITGASPRNAKPAAGILTASRFIVGYRGILKPRTHPPLRTRHVKLGSGGRAARVWRDPPWRFRRASGLVSVGNALQREDARHYRGTSLVRKRTALGPYSRTIPRVIGGF